MGRCRTIRCLETLEQWLHAITPLDAACVLAAMLLIRFSRHAGLWVHALFGLPGTFAHESAHFIVAFILGAHPSWPSLVPRRTEGGWLLGSVAFRAGYLRKLPIALAPLALAPLGLWWMAALLHGAGWPMAGVHAWIAGALLSASLPSKTDFLLAWPALALLAAMALAYVLLRMS